VARCLLSLLISLCFSSLSFASSPNESWFNRKSEGYFWYEVELEEIDKEKEEEPPAPDPQPPLSLDKKIPEGPPPLSAAWLKKNIVIYLNDAIDDPTPENIAAFLYLQKHAIDKAERFMVATEQTSLGDALLDANTQSPLATNAQYKVRAQAENNINPLVRYVGQNTSAFFFFDRKNALSIEFAKVLKMLQRTTGIFILPIDMNGGSEAFAHFEKTYPDSTHSKQLGVQGLPAFALRNRDGQFDISTQNYSSLNDLKYRILISAIRLGVITQEEFDTTNPSRTQEFMLTMAEEPSFTSETPSAKELVKYFRETGSN